MKKLITERDVIEAWKKGHSEVWLEQNGLITPAARDAAKVRNISIVRKLPHPDPVTPEPPPPQNPSDSKLVIGSDHAGFDLKETLKAYLAELEYRCEDVGAFSTESVDYPDIALAVAEQVVQQPDRLGIIIDGAGIGSAISANKVPGIRAATCHDVYTARNSRLHNNANVLSMGSRVIGIDVAKDILHTWLNTDFGGGRHKRRVDKIADIERKYNQ